MANSEHVEIVKQGAAAIETWRQVHPTDSLDLSRANFHRADLRGANLWRADLRESDLTKANLVGVNFRDAMLTGADARNANLDEADLTGADVSMADFGEADLMQAQFVLSKMDGAKFRMAVFTGAKCEHSSLVGTDFSGANFRLARFSNVRFSETDLSGALCAGTTFSATDLSSAKGLESMRHERPSSVDIDTLYLTRGALPAEFLRGCGVPDTLIEYLPSLIEAEEAISFYSCFISYSSENAEFCRKLHARMRAEHLRVWFAPEDIKAGQKVHEQIDTAINVHEKLLLVLSEESMASEWVASEIYKARRREAREGQKMLFPISIVSHQKIREWESFDSDSGKDMAREIREYFIPDFSSWQDETRFEETFQKLLEDLRKTE